MREILKLVFCLGAAAAVGQACLAEAGVLIKVRALNPLDTEETVRIQYPLPMEITAQDIQQKNITYSLDHTEDAEPPKSQFEVVYNEEEKRYFISDEIRLLPREVATLEVQVQDVWLIQRERVENLRRELETLFELWPATDVPAEESGEGESPAPPAGEEGAAEETPAGLDETRETALLMKDEILANLDKILARQDANSILKAGVEQHITAYNDNLKDLLQVQQDIDLLADLIQYNPQETDTEAAPEAVTGSEETPSVSPDQTLSDIETIDLDLDAYNTAGDAI